MGLFDKLFCIPRMKKSNAKKDEKQDPSILFETIREALFSIPPDGWNPITVSCWTYPMVPEEYSSIQAYQHRKKECDIMLYRIPDKEAFRLDMYARMQFEDVRKVYIQKGKKKITKKERIKRLASAFKKNLAMCNVIFPNCNVFMSADLIEDIGNVPGVKKHCDAPNEIDFNLIAAAPVYSIGKNVIIAISKTMMDQDYTPYDMYVLVPMFSFVSNKEADGKPNKVYQLIKQMYAESIILNSTGWTDDAIDNGMCASTAKKKPDEKEEKLENWSVDEDDEKPGFDQNAPNAMDTTPVKIGDELHWGEQENGDILFTKDQMSDIEEDLKLVLRITPPNKWGILMPSDQHYKELKGLDYSIACQNCGTTYAISMMRDYDGSRFYVFSIFDNEKKVNGKVFYEKDFANYTLCKYRMDVVMDMMISDLKTKAYLASLKDRKPDGRKRKTPSRSAKTSRKKKS